MEAGSFTFLQFLGKGYGLFILENGQEIWAPLRRSGKVTLTNMGHPPPQPDPLVAPIPNKMPKMSLSRKSQKKTNSYPTWAYMKNLSHQAE